MRNLLLNEDKKAIRKEYLLRITGVALIFLFFTICIGIVSLLPSYFFSQTKEESIRSQVEITKKSVAQREQEASARVLFNARQKLDLLISGKQKSSVANMYTLIVKVKPENVLLHNITFRKQKENKSEILVLGVAKRRDSLLSFKRFLEKEPFFDNVNLPISNLASDQDIEFSIRITGEF